MASLAGLIYIPNDGPRLMQQDKGAVLVSLDAETALKFRTLANFDAWVEELDRQRVAMGVQLRVVQP
jgi:hypothetical protein